MAGPVKKVTVLSADMNGELSKTLRQFAKYRKLPYKGVKKIWERSSKQEQMETLPQIKQFIVQAKQNDKTKNNQ